VRALPSLYEARGEFQLTVETMRRSGLGALFEAFERLKRKLEGEGLFEASRRRSVPQFPARIGIVTSPKAAALRDVLTTLRRRMPGIPVVIYPAPVQGEGAAEKIAQAIRAASVRAEVDVLIVCRGGGSIEDLWSFNEEIVARAIVECAIPVVSGVGHETDFTIADFVADARAPTPTAAAELVSPNRVELAVRLRTLGARMARDVERFVGSRTQHIDHLAKRLQHPGERIAGEARHVSHLASRLRAAATHRVGTAAWSVSDALQRFKLAAPDLDAHLARQQELRSRLQRGHARLLELREAGLARMGEHLAHLNPQSVLERGFSIVEKTDGSIVRSAGALAQGETLRMTFAHGAAHANVGNIEIPEE
jgi:exodeoxyribonuclease VII large subunit